MGDDRRNAHSSTVKYKLDFFFFSYVILQENLSMGFPGSVQVTVGQIGKLVKNVQSSKACVSFLHNRLFVWLCVDDSGVFFRAFFFKVWVVV